MVENEETEEEAEQDEQEKKKKKTNRATITAIRREAGERQQGGTGSVAHLDGGGLDGGISRGVGRRARAQVLAGERAVCCTKSKETRELVTSLSGVLVIH